MKEFPNKHLKRQTLNHFLQKLWTTSFTPSLTHSRKRSAMAILNCR